jgi:hypothetical protein
MKEAGYSFSREPAFSLTPGARPVPNCLTVFRSSTWPFKFQNDEILFVILDGFVDSPATGVTL